MKKGRIIILSGPSGAGKTTLYKKLLKSKRLNSLVERSVSATTRPRRAGERTGKDYLFLSRKQFLYKKKAGQFLESQKVFQYYYGTPKKQIRGILKKGKNVLLSIEVKGAKVVWRQYPDALRLFVKPPTFSELEKRLKKRATENKREVNARLAKAKKELKEAKHYDFVIINDQVPRAYKELEKIILGQVVRQCRLHRKIDNATSI